MLVMGEKGVNQKGLEVWLHGEALQDPTSQSKEPRPITQLMGTSESQGALLVPSPLPTPREPQLLLPLQEYIQKLMPPLIQKWNELKDEDKDLFPLLEVGELQALSHGPVPLA